MDQTARTLLKERFMEVLSQESSHRPWRSTDTWRKAEVDVMWNEVNRRRQSICKEDIDRTHVALADANAAGHSDYPEKFSLYCVELVLDLE